MLKKPNRSGHRDRRALCRRRAATRCSPGSMPSRRRMCVKALEDIGEARLKDMDAAGIDMQVLSHSAPSLQKISAGAVELARRVNDRLAEIVKRAADALCGFRGAADRRSGGGGRRACALRGEARLQGRDDPRPRRTGNSSTTSATGRSSRAPKRSTCRSICIPRCRIEAVIDAYYKEYAKDYPVLLRAAWGLHGRDRDARRSGSCSPACSSSTDQVHPRPSRRRAAVPALAHQQRPRAAGAEAGAVPRHFQRAFLRDDQRLLLRSGAAAVRAGNRHRPDPVRGRLSVRGECARPRVARARAAVRRGQGQDRERQREAAAEDVT